MSSSFDVRAIIEGYCYRWTLPDIRNEGGTEARNTIAARFSNARIDDSGRSGGEEIRGKKLRAFVASRIQTVRKGFALPNIVKVAAKVRQVVVERESLIFAPVNLA